ncbi:hypothetical protein G9A89_014617 [Geosiphon pyriformis]|nr:hypothetical protein G9A89_014617 [Geosiphon pyriformis]
MLNDISNFVCVRKSYCASKLAESQYAKEVNIRSAVNKKMKSFEVNKSHTIRSVLEHPFHKVVLDHLVVNDKLILKPNLVKSKCHQYYPLEYVFDEAFSDVMCLIGFDELFRVVSDLSNGKAAGLSGISNELWKHCNKLVLDILLVLLNSCLTSESWEGILMNTHPIVLIKTACKILFKILSDRIFAVCSAFDVLRGDNFSVLKGTTT